MSAAFERAGAKVTLSLRVVGRRDDGYHHLDALVAIVDEPHDELAIIDGAQDSELVVEPPGAAPADETNLVWKARAALGSTVGLRLRKGIPMEAGLGGGSADAAATLRLLTRAAGDVDEMHRAHDLAVDLGADVPVCLGGALHRVQGVGEGLEPLVPPVTRTYLVLATPTFGCATADVYRAWDELGGPTSPRAMAPPTGWAHAVSDKRAWRNDLEPAAVHVAPELVEFRDAFQAVAASQPMLCGSGSTYFVIADALDDAQRIAETARAELDIRCVAVATVGRTSGR